MRHKWNGKLCRVGGHRIACVKCGCVKEYVNSRPTYFINDTSYDQSPSCKPEKDIRNKPKSFKCINCDARSVNTGVFDKGSNDREKGRICLKCEKAIAQDRADDSAWYQSVRY